MNDTMKRFQASDPARDLAPPLDEDLLRATLQMPAPQTRSTSPRARGRIAVPVSIAATVVLAVVVVTRPDMGLDSGSATRPALSLDLAAQAYAMTTVEPSEIQHTLVRTRTQSPSPSGKLKVEQGSIEEWRRGTLVHRLERIGTTALDHVIDDNGIMRQISEDGALRIVRPSDNEDAATVIAREQAGFVETFRSNYEQGRLDPAGDATFAGRPAIRYRVTERAQGPTSALPGPVQVYFVDRSTGAPLGYVSTLKMSIATPGGESTTSSGTFEYTATVEAIETLASTPENRAKVTTFTLPRRRDRDGCVRAPLERAERAQSSDTTSRTDCGGTPGASIEP